MPEEETDDSETESGQSADRETKSKNSIADISLEEMKRLSDDQYFMLFMKMALKKKKPVRVRLPTMRLVDTGTAQTSGSSRSIYIDCLGISLM